jgi:beta-lactamase regulating signal transducer with metallopeptidase domain
MSSLQTIVSPSGLLDLALKSAAVMLIAWAVAVLLGRASAAWRHLVWCLSVVSLLLLPALSLALPAWRVGWMPQWSAEPTMVAATESSGVAHENWDEPFSVQPLPPIVALPASTVEQVSAPNSGGAAAVQSPSAPRDSFPWLPIAWALGGLLSLVPLAVGLVQLAALYSGSRVIDDPRWLVLLGELRRQLAVRRGVQLRQSDAAAVPLTWGALWPVLLVPATASTWPDERRRLALLHELAHIRRCDWLTQLVAHFACGVYWFNPLVWLAAGRMRVERERACDDLVLAAGAKASDYAQELLLLAAGLSDSSFSTLAAVPMARRGALEDRVRGIVDNRRSRAALTMAAICLGAAIAAATIAPVAMLRAAPAKPPQPAAEEQKSDDPTAAKKPAVEKAAQRDPTPEEIEDRASGIRISVLNSTGDRGIPEFRVIAGVSSGSVTSEFEKRTGRSVINWQPHTCRIGKEGDYVWPLAQAYDEMALRVEADGYQPQVFTGVKKSKGVQHIVFQLAEDKGAAGRVLTPDGKPAADATVALALPHQSIAWEAGKLRGADDPLPEKPGDRWQRPRFAKTDSNGAFRLPTEFEPAAVLVVHESGVLEVAYDAWQKSPELTLQRWGGILGQILWQDKLGADEDISLTVYRDEYGYPGMIASYARARSDKDGKFAFDRVLPGLVQISRPVKPAEPGNSGITEVNLNGLVQHVKVAAGDATRVLVGGQGRTVTGKFVGLDSWEGATYHFHPEAPHVGFGGDDVRWKAFNQLKQSPIGPLLFRDKQAINQDGSFTIERMLPGRYQLFLSAPGFTRYAASTVVQVDPEVPDQRPADIALGEIATVKRLAKPAQPAVEKLAEESVEKRVQKPVSKTVTIRGKVVDDATGEPIGRLITQAGKFDPADPKKVTWGGIEGRSEARDGSFSVTVRWADGWTARVIADGYIPQPVIESAPPDDKDELRVTIRLKRGPTVRGVVLDHVGNPVKDASVFAIGPTGLNLAAGQAWSRAEGIDHEARSVRTAADGRFELPAGEATSLAVSCAAFDAWPAAIPAQGEVTVRLPEPARVEIELDIDGADKESVIFYQLITEDMPAFKGLFSSREVPMANPGKLTFAALPPGKYQFGRDVTNWLRQFGIGAVLERQFFELKAGETKSIQYVRKTGARVRGKVTWPADTKLTGIIVSVRGVRDQKSFFGKHPWPVVYASHPAAEDGTYRTERILPGKYVLEAQAYSPLPPDQRTRLIDPVPSHHAQATIDVPAEGELTVDDLALKPIKTSE